jgi:hypothetical protein
VRATARWRDEPRAPGRTVIVDIDGVLSDASTRQHFLHGPHGRRDWDGFFGSVGDDAPLRDVPQLIRLLSAETIVVLLSSRPGWVADRTVEWLERHAIRWDLLVLRAGREFAGAADFKRDVLRDLRAAGFAVVFAFDDDQRTIDMYRSEDVPALYVHSGYYGAGPP